VRRITTALIICGMGLFLGAGCERYLDSRDPVQSLPPAPPRVVNLSASLENQAVALAWEVNDTAAAVRYRIYVSDSTGAAYARTDSTAAFTYMVTGLVLNQKYFFQVAAVVSSGVEGTIPARYPLASAFWG